ncbi:hypothetical protein AV926_04875 [Myroides marinus]|uniref:Uncharacterized protein n=1 Tax=Myroides marinus TaxID=703342 RepID=A0A161SL45_9FLAO|nr:hypothetical protein [Myroides marinus]KZE82885.1 hypothetical protein AV926_04875 [Myroides marinus]
MDTSLEIYPKILDELNTYFESSIIHHPMTKHHINNFHEEKASSLIEIMLLYNLSDNLSLRKFNTFFNKKEQIKIGNPFLDNLLKNYIEHNIKFNIINLFTEIFINNIIKRKSYTENRKNRSYLIRRDHKYLLATFLPKNKENEMKISYLCDIVNFKKYKGKSIIDIIEIDPLFIINEIISNNEFIIHEFIFLHPNLNPYKELRNEAIYINRLKILDFFDITYCEKYTFESVQELYKKAKKRQNNDRFYFSKINYHTKSNKFINDAFDGDIDAYNSWND